MPDVRSLIPLAPFNRMGPIDTEKKAVLDAVALYREKYLPAKLHGELAMQAALLPEEPTESDWKAVEQNVLQGLIRYNQHDIAMAEVGVHSSGEVSKRRDVARIEMYERFNTMAKEYVVKLQSGQIDTPDIAELIGNSSRVFAYGSKAGIDVAWRNSSSAIRTGSQISQRVKKARYAEKRRLGMDLDALLTSLLEKIGV